MMYIGYQGTDKYSVNNTEIPVIQIHNELGVVVCKDLKIIVQCRVIVAKGFKSLYSINRVFSYVDAKTFLTLYAAFVLHTND